MTRLVFFLIATLIFPSITGYAALPADISFVVLDVKYSEEEGVKICEMQYGMSCIFKGINYETKKNEVVGRRICDFLSQYFDRFWFVTRGLSGEFKPVMRRRKSWKEHIMLLSLQNDKKFLKYAEMPVKDPTRLSSYNGLYIAHYTDMNKEKQEQYSGVLYMNAAFRPHFGEDFRSDKYYINQLFDSYEELKQLQPKWNLYEKGDSDELVEQILTDFPNDMVVLKPRTGFRGKGVIIVQRDELQETLRYIFTSPAEKLKKNPDITYNYWGEDRHPNFLVEEYCPSDPIHIAHLGEGTFDGTMRVSILLSYDRGEIDMQFPAYFWKLPEKQLEEEGTVTEKHKSYYGGSYNYYGTVSKEIRAKIEEQMRGPFTLLYQRLLDEG